MTKVLAVTLCFGALVVSATGARSQNADFFAGKSITVVIGNDATMAMERGEVDARFGWSWGSLKSRSKPWLDDKKIEQLGVKLALFGIFVQGRFDLQALVEAGGAVADYHPFRRS